MKNWTGPGQVADNWQQDGKCFSVTGSKLVTAKDLIELDPAKTYRLSGYFKSAGAKPNIVLVGLRLFNSDRKIIDASSVNTVSGSDTTLIAEAGSGSTTLKIRNASAWEEAFRARRLLIAVGTDITGEYKDLPNFQPYRVTDLQKDEDGWNVSLEKPRQNVSSRTGIAAPPISAIIRKNMICAARLSANISKITAAKSVCSNMPMKPSAMLAISLAFSVSATISCWISMSRPGAWDSAFPTTSL